MARLWQSGFELNSTASNMEFSSANGVIQATTVRSGGFAGQITSLSSGSAKGFAYQFATPAANGPYFFRIYINIATLPSAANRIISLNNTSGLTGTSEISIKLTNAGVLQLFNGVTQIGSNSAVLSTNTWYCIEIKFDNTGGAAAGIAEARIDQGTAFATASNLTIAAGILELSIGGNLLFEAQTTGNWFFDDLAINDSTGTKQTGYPGSGKIIHLKPAANGDTVQWATGNGGTGTAPTGNYTRVQDVPPDDATTYNQNHTLNNLDHFTLDATPAAISSGDTINVVQVNVRSGNSDGVNTGDDIQAQLESQASGTLVSGSTIAGTSSTTFRTNGLTTVQNPTLTSYTDPQGGGAWTKALLDTAQAGYKTTATHIVATRVSTVWVSVDSTPVAVAATTGPGWRTLLGTGQI